MKTLDEEEKALVENTCCAVCKYCVYSGLPGAYCCVNKVVDNGPYGFIDLFSTCDKWEYKEVPDETN